MLTNQVDVEVSWLEQSRNLDTQYWIHKSDAMTWYTIRSLSDQAHDTISVQSFNQISHGLCANSTGSETIETICSFFTSPIMPQPQRERKRDKLLKLFRSGSSRATSPAPPVATLRTEQAKLQTNPSQEVHLQSQSQLGSPSPWKIAADGAQLVLGSLDRCLAGVPIAGNVVGALNVLLEIANVGGPTIMAVICTLMLDRR
jgi:hypothetical protein